MIVFGRAKEKPRVMRIGKIANFVLFWSIGFFMIAVRPVAWVLYVAGGALYLYSGALYVVRWAREKGTQPAALTVVASTVRTLATARRRRAQFSLCLPLLVC